jgi:hypothetical protein
VWLGQRTKEIVSDILLARDPGCEGYCIQAELDQKLCSVSHPEVRVSGTWHVMDPPNMTVIHSTTADNVSARADDHAMALDHAEGRRTLQRQVNVL